MEILRDDVAVPPKLAAAIFRAAATLPGTVVLPHVVDAAGRPGIAVAMPEYGLSTELIFDPRTYRFTGSADVVTSSRKDTGNDPTGTIFFTMAVLRTAITATAPVVPASDITSFSHPPSEISPADVATMRARLSLPLTCTGRSTTPSRFAQWRRSRHQRRSLTGRRQSPFLYRNGQLPWSTVINRAR